MQDTPEHKPERARRSILVNIFVCSDHMATSRSTSRNLPRSPGAPHTQTRTNNLLIYAMAGDRSQQGRQTQSQNALRLESRPLTRIEYARCRPGAERMFRLGDLNMDEQMVVDLESDDRHLHRHRRGHHRGGDVADPAKDRPHAHGHGAAVAAGPGHQRLARDLRLDLQGPLLPHDPGGRAGLDPDVHARVRLEDLRRHQSQDCRRRLVRGLFPQLPDRGVSHQHQDPPHRGCGHGLSAPVAAPARLGDGLPRPLQEPGFLHQRDGLPAHRRSSACSRSSSPGCRACSTTWRSRPTS